MYSARINGEPTTFGTSGFLYRSNKVMYDRATRSLWHQFTGEPIIGPLADSGIKLAFFPALLTTWEEWVAEHPDTTVLALDTGVYEPDFYVREADPDATYYDYFQSAETMFPVWLRSQALDTKQVVVGLEVGGQFKAYPVAVLQEERVVNDTLGGTEVVIVASSESQAARAFERKGHEFSQGDSLTKGVPTALVDSAGARWRVTEEFLVSETDPSQKLARLPTHTSFWFGWYQFHPETGVYGQP